MKIWKAQSTDPEITQNLGKFTSDEFSDFKITNDVLCRFRDLIWVPVEVRIGVLKAAHAYNLSIHLGSTKMYCALRRQYLWHGMKKNIVDFVSRCLTCQRVKAKHQRPGGLFQDFPS